MEWEVEVGAWWSQSIQRFEFMPFYMACNFIKLQFASLVSNQTILFDVGYDHSYDILGVRMLWKPKEARILKNLIEF